MGYLVATQSHPPGRLAARWLGARVLGKNPAPWQDLLTRSAEANPFYTPEYLTASADLAETDIRCLTIWDGEGTDAVLLGLFPLQPAGFGDGIFVPALEFARNDFIRSTAPLIDRDRGPEVWRAFLHALASNEKGSRLLISRFHPAAGATRATLAEVVRTDGLCLSTIDNHERAAVAGGMTWHEFGRRIERHRRNELKRQNRRLGALGDVTFATVTAPGLKQAALEDFLRIENSGWKGTAGTAMVAKASSERFVRLAFSGPEAEIDVVALNGRAIAIGLNLRRDGQLFTIKTTYDEAYRAVAPGMALAAYQARQTLERGDLDHLDSCAIPGHPMGDLWLDRTGVEWFALAPSPTEGRHRVELVATTLRGLARLRAWAKSLRSRS